MSDERFLVELAGRKWALPHLTFRAIKAIQPALFRIYSDAGGDAITPQSIASLTEPSIDRLAEATWRAVAEVDKGLSYEEFLGLPFSVGDLITAFPSVAKAAGLRPATSAPTPEAAPTPGKSITTP